VGVGPVVRGPGFLILTVRYSPVTAGAVTSAGSPRNEGYEMRVLLPTVVALILPLASLADPPRPQTLPDGKWKVEFANGVVERVEIKKDGAASVTEPARTSDGKVTSLQGAFLFVCDDDRIARRTPVGRRMVVEHWFPADQYPNGTPVRGIADVTD
jgi:hypothetical protein